MVRKSVSPVPIFPSDAVIARSIRKHPESRALDEDAGLMSNAINSVRNLIQHYFFFEPATRCLRD